MNFSSENNPRGRNSDFSKFCDRAGSGAVTNDSGSQCAGQVLRQVPLARRTRLLFRIHFRTCVFDISCSCLIMLFPAFSLTSNPEKICRYIDPRLLRVTALVRM